MKIKLLFALAALTVSTISFAFDDNEDCHGESGTTYSQACIETQVSKELDKELNANYKKIIDLYKKQEGKEELKLLLAAQRSWIQYRKKVCEFENQAFGGINSISWAECYSRVTETRLNELNEINTD